MLVTVYPWRTFNKWGDEMQVGDKVRVLECGTIHTGKVGTVRSMHPAGLISIGVAGLFTGLDALAFFAKSELVVVWEYNVSIDWPDGNNAGFIVTAPTGDMAIAAAKAVCTLAGQIGWCGSSLQRRDTREENNLWFDGRYPNATRI